MSPTSGVLRRGIPHEGAAVGRPRVRWASAWDAPAPSPSPPRRLPTWTLGRPPAQGRLVRFNGVPAAWERLLSPEKADEKCSG